VWESSSVLSRYPLLWASQKKRKSSSSSSATKQARVVSPKKVEPRQTGLLSLSLLSFFLFVCCVADELVVEGKKNHLGF